MAERREVIWSFAQHQPGYDPTWSRSSDIELTFTRKGLEVCGYYDSIVSLGETVLIPWAEVDAMRQQVAKVRHGQPL